MQPVHTVGAIGHRCGIDHPDYGHRLAWSPCSLRIVEAPQLTAGILGDELAADVDEVAGMSVEVDEHSPHLDVVLLGD